MSSLQKLNNTPILIFFSTQPTVLQQVQSLNPKTDPSSNRPYPPLHPWFDEDDKKGRLNVNKLGDRSPDPKHAGIG